MCLGMNPDQVPEGVHCASTSNRNFEGRQGKVHEPILYLLLWQQLLLLTVNCRRKKGGRIDGNSTYYNIHR